MQEGKKDNRCLIASCCKTKTKAAIKKIIEEIVSEVNM